MILSNINKAIHECRFSLGNIKYSCSNARRNKKIILKMSVFLKNGKYRTSIHGDHIYESSTSPQLGKNTFLSLGTLNRCAIPFVKLVYWFYTTKVKTLTKHFNGTEIIISSSNTEYKIFDFTSNIVLSFYQNTDKLIQTKKNKDYFSQYFDTPPTINFDVAKHIWTERYIDHVPYQTLKCATFLCKKIVNYNLSIKGGEKISINLDSEETVLFAKRFGDSPLLIKTIGLPKVFTHGDLWSSNVIYNGSLFFVTDYEAARERFFLYDFFCFIFSEWFLKDDSSLLDYYMAGFFDSILGKLPWRYDKTEKDVYLLAFIVAITCERWKKPSCLDKKIELALKLYIPNY